MKRLLLAAVLAAAAFAASGCSSEPDTADAVVASASEEQAAALADGTVTLAEYRRGVDAQASCVRDAGFDTGDVELESDKIRLGFDIGLNGDDEAEINRASETSDDCYETYVSEIEKTYYEAQVPSGAARESVFASLVECFDEAGIEGATSSMSEEQIVEIVANSPEPTSGFLCMDAHSTLFSEGMFQ